MWAGGADVISIDSPRMAELMRGESVEEIEQIRNEVHSNVARLKQVGYLDLSPEAATQFSINALSARFLPQEITQNRLSFPYADFNLHVDGLEKRGMLAAHVDVSDVVAPDIFNDIAVVYFHPSKDILVTVQQVDESVSSPKTVLYAEFANVTLGDYPGSLVTRKAKDGKVVSTLMWFTDRFRFEVSAGGYTKIDELERLAMEVGASIAKR
ncbi:MAG: hypothetical protein U1B30_11485 [Pseudomonadota bacterium]|nr:hypothetical protein [Pseudomonadota bacterium]